MIKDVKGLIKSRLLEMETLLPSIMTYVSLTNALKSMMSFQIITTP